MTDEQRKPADRSPEADDRPAEVIEDLELDDESSAEVQGGITVRKAGDKPLEY